jgi:dienelactone hydrolase
MKRLLALLLLLSTSVAAMAGSPPTALERTSISTGGLVGKLYRPAGAQGRLPGVIVLGGSEGGLNPAVSHEARLIARHGYAVLQLAYFGAPRLPETLQLIPVEYFEAAVEWLQQRPGVDRGHIGILGTSVGGEAALLVAAHDPAIRVVVAAVPADVVWQGLSGGIDRHPPSSFMLGGRALPDLPYGWGGALRDVYQRYAGGLPALPRHPDAIIPVERINGAVMLICGARDRVWPSCAMAAAVAARLKAHSFPHAVQFLAYPRAGHAVFGPPLDPSSPDYADLGSLGGSAAANDAARQTAWRDSLTFLDTALKPGAMTLSAGLIRPSPEPHDN